MEVPNYSTKQNLARVLLPRILTLLMLSLLLYVGIRINFLVFNMEFPDPINFIVIILIMILIAADIFLTNMKNKESKIYFFNDRIEIRGKDATTISLATITSAAVEKNVYDKMLNTGDIILSDGQAIKSLNYPERISQYIMQLLRRAPEIKKKI